MNPHIQQLPSAAEKDGGGAAPTPDNGKYAWRDSRSSSMICEGCGESFRTSIGNLCWACDQELEERGAIPDRGTIGRRSGLSASSSSRSSARLSSALSSGLVLGRRVPPASPVDSLSAISSSQVDSLKKLHSPWSPAFVVAGAEKSAATATTADKTAERSFGASLSLSQRSNPERGYGAGTSEFVPWGTSTTSHSQYSSVSSQQEERAARSAWDISGGLTQWYSTRRSSQRQSDHATPSGFVVAVPVLPSGFSVRAGPVQLPSVDGTGTSSAAPPPPRPSATAAAALTETEAGETKPKFRKTRRGRRGRGGKRNRAAEEAGAGEEGEPEAADGPKNFSAIEEEAGAPGGREEEASGRGPKGGAAAGDHFYGAVGSLLHAAGDHLPNAVDLHRVAARGGG